MTSGPEKVITEVSERLKKMKEMEPPEWSKFVKTGTNRQRPPQQEDWWWTRAASVLRRVSIEGNIGVSRMRNVYGGRKNKGHKPEHKYKASGSVLRKIMQQLEAAKLLKSDKKKGRMITDEGRKLLASAAKGTGKKDA